MPPLFHFVTYLYDFGRRLRFIYAFSNACGVLQASDIPARMLSHLQSGPSLALIGG
jgi:hypothetical protein